MTVIKNSHFLKLTMKDQIFGYFVKKNPTGFKLLFQRIVNETLRD